MSLIRIKDIVLNPEQPRKTYSQANLEALAQTIEQSGLEQYIKVEDNGDGTYTLVDGQRRMQAHQLLKMEFIEANIHARSNHGGRELLLGALIANVQREDMNPIDEARAYQRLRDVHGMTQLAIAESVGKNVTQINSLLLLLKLEPEIQELIAQGKLPKDANLARALLKAPDGISRKKLALKIAEKNMTVQAGIKLVERFTEALTTPLPKSDSPVLEMVRRQTGQPISLSDAPGGWSAIQQLRAVPPWVLVAKTAFDTCVDCSLRAVANPATCGPCPLTMCLRRLVEYGK